MSEPKRALDDPERKGEEQKIQENAVRALVDLYEVVMRDFLVDAELRSDVKNTSPI